MKSKTSNPTCLLRAAAEARRFVTDGACRMIVMAVADSTEVRKGWAWADGGREAPDLAGRPLAIASITKAITGVAIACLADEGLLRYEDPVVKWVPEFGDPPWRRAITLGHIFTHATGLQQPELASYVEMDLDPRVGHAGLFGPVPVFEPGTHFQYSTLTYQLLNDIVFRQVGLSMSGLMQRRLFEPCGMTRTSFSPPAEWQPIPSLQHPMTTPEQLNRFAEREVSGGGLWSTVDDLVRLGQALLKGRLMGRAAFDRMTRPQPGLPFLGKEGLSGRTWGWNREKQDAFSRQPDSGFYHGGATGSVLWIDPAQDLIMAFVTDRWSGENAQAFTVLNALYDAGT